MSKLPLIALTALVLSLCFFAPRLWLVLDYSPGTGQWDRAITFMKQVEDPFRGDIENVQKLRLLPPLLARALHLEGTRALILPWIGVFFATLFVAFILFRERSDFRYVLGGTVLFASTSAVTVPIILLGMNDAWVWLGLLSVAFARSRWGYVIPILLCPWIDERFVIGFPLAWMCGVIDDRRPLISFDTVLAAVLMVIYGIGRLLASRHLGLAMESRHLATLLPQAVVALKYGYLGWWMGLKAGWIPIVVALFYYKRVNLLFVVVFVLTALATIILTEDQSRSAAVACPVVVLGLLAINRVWFLHAPRIAVACGIAGLLIPTALVGNTSIQPIDNIAVEILRLVRP